MIKALIVGLGGWGQVLVNSVQGKSDKIKFVHGLTKTSSDEAKSYAKEKGFGLLDCSYEEAVARDEVDVVVLASPHSIHADQVVAAAAAGKPIACDKPFTLNSADAKRAVNAATGAGRQITIESSRQRPSFGAALFVRSGRRFRLSTIVYRNPPLSSFCLWVDLWVWKGGV